MKRFLSVFLFGQILLFVGCAVFIFTESRKAGVAFLVTILVYRVARRTLNDLYRF